MRLFLAKKEHLDQVFRGRMPPIPTIEVSDIADLAPGQVAIGYPTRNHGPIAPVLLVSRDNEIQDILAWVTTYLPDIRPLTSSCRAVTLSDWVKLTGAAIPQNKSPVASPWSGLVLGECYAQARGRTNLRRIPLAGALSCLSFTVARLTHLWSSAPHFDKLVERVVENHRRLLPRRLTFDSATLLPIWSSLWALQGVEPFASQDIGSHSDIIASFKAVASGYPLIQAIQQNLSHRIPPEVLRIFAPDLSAEEKVRNFDLLVAGQIGVIGSKSMGDFIIGAACSEISSGSLSHIDLLGEHIERCPGALLWYGALSGLVRDLHWSGELNGLGRNIEKALVKPFDWESMPDCDVALSELTLDESADGSIDLSHLRGASNRFVEVELCPGVNAVVPLSEGHEAPAASSRPSSLQPSLGLPQSVEMGDAIALISAIEDQALELKRLLHGISGAPTRFPGSSPKRALPKGRKR